MVAMGRALMMDPSVLLLDEPSAGLSPINQDEVFARIDEIKRAGVSVVMVEQNARKCLQIADAAFVLDQGRNAYTGTGRELLDDPTVIELYLGTLGPEPLTAARQPGDATLRARRPLARPARCDATVGPDQEPTTTCSSIGRSRPSSPNVYTSYAPARGSPYSEKSSAPEAPS